MYPGIEIICLIQNAVVYDEQPGRFVKECVDSNVLFIKTTGIAGLKINNNSCSYACLYKTIFFMVRFKL